jgi:hypothetical protein
MLRAGWLKILEEFLFSTNPDRLWGPPHTYPVGTGGKAVGREGDNSSESSA